MKTVIAVVAFLALGASCPPPVPRPVGDTTGGARWAFAIAQPSITAFAADAELRTILGGPVGVDGRLPSNVGSWSFVAWSPTHSTIQVNVSFNGVASSSTRTEAAPGPGVQRPIPSDWADSIAVFTATDGKRLATATVANLVALNAASYAQAPNKATWAINFNAGPNLLVSAEGAYIGPE